MIGYTKLFEGILTSTIWSESNETRLVWITMLALRNSRHIVEASIPGLAYMARVSLEDTEKAIKKLSSPDPYSRTKDFEGRRIEEVDGGWKILNGEKYARKLNQEDRREYLRLKQQEHRAAKQSKPLGGERAYVASLERGEPQHEQNRIVDNSHRPRTTKEEPL